MKHIQYPLILLLIALNWHNAAQIHDTHTQDRITQTFIIGVYCDAQLSAHHFGENLFQDFCESLFTVEQAKEIVQQYAIGGIIFLGKSTLTTQKDAMQQINEASRVPLIYMQDFECGLGMRLIDQKQYPLAHVLEHEASAAVELYAADIAHEMTSLGVHINLAPVCDVRYEDNNITRLRAFSSDPSIVSRHTIAYVDGLQKNGIAGCAKHFPGHGPTTNDSHYDLPIIHKSLAELEAHDIVPFIKLIENNVPLIMTGHLLIPAVDREYPASLSRIWVHDYLKNKLGYQGIIITDALNMKSLDAWCAGEKELLALKAGNDMLLCPHKDINKVVEYIQYGLQTGLLCMKELKQKVKHILKFKKNLITYQNHQS